MPEKITSYSSHRFSALLDFQREVDPTYPSHIGYKNAVSDGLGGKAPGYQQVRHGDSPREQNWSSSLTALLSSPFRSKASSSPPSGCRDESVTASRATLVRSQGQFSPQKFIRNALKRAFSRDDLVVNAKKARFEEYSTVEPMVFG